MPPVQIGEVMRASGIGFVLEAGSGSQHKVGETVSVPCGELCIVNHKDCGSHLNKTGWQEYIVVPDKAAQKIVYVFNHSFLRPWIDNLCSVPKGAEALDFLNTLGYPGQPRAGNFWRTR
jgi:hypothetical protein